MKVFGPKSLMGKRNLENTFCVEKVDSNGDQKAFVHVWWRYSTLAKDQSFGPDVLVETHPKSPQNTPKVTINHFEEKKFKVENEGFWPKILDV